MRFKKTVTVDAVQYLGPSESSAHHPTPTDTPTGVLWVFSERLGAMIPICPSPFGPLRVSFGDFIVTDDKGNTYPMSKADFYKVYEPV